MMRRNGLSTNAEYERENSQYMGSRLWRETQIDAPAFGFDSVADRDTNGTLGAIVIEIATFSCL